MDNFNIDLSHTTDDDFFGSLKGSKSSKLQQIFVDETLSSNDKQQSLKYQRPKDIATSSNVNSITLMAKVVRAYKRGESQGKVGFALVQNTDCTCNVIIYKTKANILATLKLQPEKDLLYKQTTYWQFYDEESTYWSFTFDTSTDEEEFVRKLYSNNISYKESEGNELNIEKHSEIQNSDNEAQNCYMEHKNEKPKTAPSESKSSLIKRMAKMGKPLPTLYHSKQLNTTEFSDSSDTEVISRPVLSSQNPSIAPKSRKLSSNIENQELVPSIVGLSSVASAVYPINALESQYMQMLLTEQRTQGSELRMNMSKLENKMEKVLDKLDFYDRNDGKQKIEKDDEILELEEKILILKKENRRLKQNVQEISSEEAVENNVKAIVYELKEDLELFNIDCKQQLKNVLIQLTDKLKKSHCKFEEMQEKVNETEMRVKEVNAELELNKRKNVELKNEICLLNQRENQLKQQLSEKETEILKQKHAVLDLQNKLLKQNKETLNTPSDDLVKSIMNNLYIDIGDKLSNANFSHSEQIMSLIASCIKENTLKCLLQSKLQNS